MPSKTIIRAHMEALAERLGYEYHELSHLTRALYCKKERGKSNYQNDQMATLGDAVLGLIVAEHFFCAGLDKDEITEKKSRLVSNATLKRLCDTVEAHRFAFNDRYFADDAPPHGRLPHKEHDFYMEAIIAAVYLDRGLGYTREWLLCFFEKHARDLLDL